MLNITRTSSCKDIELVFAGLENSPPAAQALALQLSAVPALICASNLSHIAYYES